jgi:hypothetical protein
MLLAPLFYDSKYMSGIPTPAAMAVRSLITRAALVCLDATTAPLLYMHLLYSTIYNDGCGYYSAVREREAPSLG